MKKNKFYNYLSKKYDLPKKYIKFVVDPIYIFKANIELKTEEAENIESSIYWDRAKEEFEVLRNEYSSIFYGM